MQPRPVREPEVDVRRRVVQPPSTEGGEPLGEAAYGAVVEEADRHLFEAVAAVDVDRVRAR